MRRGIDKSIRTEALQCEYTVQRTAASQTTVLFGASFSTPIVAGVLRVAAMIPGMPGSLPIGSAITVEESIKTPKTLR
jgi:hypothetical protein